MSNTFKKYCAGVYVMKSPELFNHGDNAVVETKYGDEVDVSVWKKLGKYADGEYAYSVVRLDGKCAKQRLLNKAEKREEWAISAARKANEYHAKSNKDRDFLGLAEPIKVGHHSERRHRKIIEQANNNMEKCVMMDAKAKVHLDRVEGLKSAAENIFIDVPESLPQLAAAIDKLAQKIANAKKQKMERFVITNAQANLRRYKKRLETAEKLWGLE